MDNTQLAQRPQRGLYDPSFEHDACGVGFLAHLRGTASHDVVDRGLMDLVSVYRDAIAVALGAPGELVNAEMRADMDEPASRLVLAAQEGGEP